MQLHLLPWQGQHSLRPHTDIMVCRFRPVLYPQHGIPGPCRQDHPHQHRLSHLDRHRRRRHRPHRHPRLPRACHLLAPFLHLYPHSLSPRPETGSLIPGPTMSRHTPLPPPTQSPIPPHSLISYPAGKSFSAGRISFSPPHRHVVFCPTSPPIEDY